MDQIVSLLTALGRTADEVAAALRAQGVRGVRGATTFDNPVVRHLYRNLDVSGLLEVRANSSLVLVRQGTVFRLELPAPVREFLAAFDRGLYPHLEQP